MSNYGKVLPDGLIDAIHDTGLHAGIDKGKLFDMHLANIRGDEKALLKSMADVAKTIIEEDEGFASRDSVGYSDVSDEDVLMGLAHKARRDVEAWLEEKAPDGVRNAYRFDQMARAYMTRNEQPDFTFEEPKETLDEMIALGLEVVTD